MTPTEKSYRKIRQTIGALGLLLPLLVYLHTGIIWHCWQLQDSISHYYFTSGNVFFVGILSILGLVLLYYPAHKNEKKGDKWLTSFSGICAWAVAYIPTNSNSCDSCAMFNIPCNKTRQYIHLTCAGIMLFIFSYMSIKLFTRSNPLNYNIDNTMKWKKIRNCIYITCGLITLLSIVAIFILMKLEDYLHPFPFTEKYVFWLEVSAIVPFGFAWLIKGGFLFTDDREISTVGKVFNAVRMTNKN